MIETADLNDVLLFKGMNEKEINAALEFLKAHKEHFKKNEMILHAGDHTNELGLILSGSVFLEQNDLWGNRSILTSLETHQFFAEVFAMVPNTKILVDVTAAEDTDILFLKINCLLEENSHPKAIVNKLTQNLLRISMNMNLRLTTRNFHTSPKTIRDRILSFLNTYAIETGEKYFDIPYDRQALADYLNVDRSALSKELSSMKKEGLIDYQKNHFRIL